MNPLTIISPYTVLIIRAIRRIEASFNSLVELLGDECVEILGGLYKSFLTVNPQENIQVIEEFSLSPAANENADKETKEMRTSIRALCLTISHLAVAHRAGADALKAGEDENFADGIFLVWNAIGNAELQRGEFLELMRGHKLKPSEIAAAMKSAISQTQSARAKAPRPGRRESSEHEPNEIKGYLARQKIKNTPRAEAVKNAEARFGISLQYARRLASEIGWKRGTS